MEGGGRNVTHLKHVELFREGLCQENGDFVDDGVVVLLSLVVVIVVGRLPRRPVDTHGCKKER